MLDLRVDAGGHPVAGEVLVVRHAGPVLGDEAPALRVRGKSVLLRLGDERDVPQLVVREHVRLHRGEVVGHHLLGLGLEPLERDLVGGVGVDGTHAAGPLEVRGGHFAQGRLVHLPVPLLQGVEEVLAHAAVRGGERRRVGRQEREVAGGQRAAEAQRVLDDPVARPAEPVPRLVLGAVEGLVLELPGLGGELEGAAVPGQRGRGLLRRDPRDSLVELGLGQRQVLVAVDGGGELRGGRVDRPEELVAQGLGAYGGLLVPLGGSGELAAGEVRGGRHGGLVALGLRGLAEALGLGGHARDVVAGTEVLHRAVVQRVLDARRPRRVVGEVVGRAHRRDGAHHAGADDEGDREAEGLGGELPEPPVRHEHAADGEAEALPEPLVLRVEPEQRGGDVGVPLLHHLAQHAVIPHLRELLEGTSRVVVVPREEVRCVVGEHRVVLQVLEPLVVGLLHGGLHERLDVGPDGPDGLRGQPGDRPGVDGGLERRVAGEFHVHPVELELHRGEPVGGDVLLQAALAGDLLDEAPHRAAHLGAAGGVDEADVVHDVGYLPRGVAHELGRALGLQGARDARGWAHQLGGGREPYAAEEAVEPAAGRLRDVLQEVEEHAVGLGAGHEVVVAVLPRGLLEAERGHADGLLAGEGLVPLAEHGGHGLARGEQRRAPGARPQREVEPRPREGSGRGGEPRGEDGGGLGSPFAEVGKPLDRGVAEGPPGGREEPRPAGIVRHAGERGADRALGDGVGHLLREPRRPLPDAGDVGRGLLHDTEHALGRRLDGLGHERGGLEVRLGRLRRRLVQALGDVGLGGRLDEHPGELGRAGLRGAGDAGVGEEPDGAPRRADRHHGGARVLERGAGERELGEEPGGLVEDAADLGTPGALGLHLAFGAGQRRLYGLLAGEGLPALHLAERVGRDARVGDAAAGGGPEVGKREPVGAEDPVAEDRVEEVVLPGAGGDPEELGPVGRLGELVRGHDGPVDEGHALGAPGRHRLRGDGRRGGLGGLGDHGGHGLGIRGLRLPQGIVDGRLGKRPGVVQICRQRHVQRAFQG